MTTRRAFLQAASTVTLGTLVSPGMLPARTMPRLRLTGVELLSVRATERTVWLFVRLQTDAGLTGLGEASDAFGFLNTTPQDAARMAAELKRLFALVEGLSPFEINAFRQKCEPLVPQGGLVTATAASAIEQALWDLAGKAFEVPTYTLFGGRVRDSLPVYANVNRATRPRTPAGFAASAKAAVLEGFQAVKAAPWDGFPKPGSPPNEIEAAAERGIDCVLAMREAIGPEPELMVDCHSFFDVPLAARVAARLEPARLAWYEEPVPPENVKDTLEIRRRIQQPMAGGELLFGVSGFTPLIRDAAVHVIMPDVKHCGGLLELTRIAAVAQSAGISVAPHNPSGPVATAASVQVCAVLPNFRLLELQWGEVDWRGNLLRPAEQFHSGQIRVPNRPGLGIELNEDLVEQKRG